MHTKDRAKQILGLDLFKHNNKTDEIGSYELNCPYDDQYVLRMIVKIPHEEFKIPTELEWLRGIIMDAQTNQEALGIRHPFCYVTVRHGIVRTQNDDVWHVDGFSTAISHLPEQNYIIANCYPTEYVERAFDFPTDFDPDIHNVHMFFQDNIIASDIKTVKVNTLYCLDPYIVHRRVQVPENTLRTFVRISFTPIEIMDDNNTPNPLLPMRKYNRDGVIIRNKLKRYENK